MLHLYYHALVYKGLDKFPRLLTFTQKTRVFPPNAGIIFARGVDGGPTLTQHWSFVKGESRLLTLIGKLKYTFICLL